MSEYDPGSMPQINLKEYSNGAVHLYGVDKAGKQHHLKEADVLAAYGYELGPDGVAQPIGGYETPVVSQQDAEVTTPDVDIDNPYTVEEYGKAVADESKQYRVKNSETGKMDTVIAKDLTYREWIQAQESRAKARFNSATMPFAKLALYREQHPDSASDLGNGDAAKLLADVEDMTRILQMEGKPIPTEDDIKYLVQLMKQSTESRTRDPETPDDPSDATQEVPELEDSPEYIAAQTRLTEARDKLAKITAGRETRTFHRRGGKYGKKALEAARQEYDEAMVAAGLLGIERMEAAGFDEGMIEQAVNLASLSESIALTETQQQFERAQSEGKLLGKFYEFWARHSQAPLLSKQGMKDLLIKAGVMAPVGVAVGIAAAPLAASAGMFAGAVFAATRFTRGVMNTKISKEADAPRLAEQKATDRQRMVDVAIQQATRKGRAISQSEIDAILRGETDSQVAKNRKRAIVAGVAAAAIGGAVSYGIHEMGWFGHHSSPNPAPKATPDPRLGSPEFKTMVEVGNKIHAQVDADPANAALSPAERSAIADRLVAEALDKMSHPVTTVTEAVQTEIRTAG